jgi:membrane protein involved in colicin uptake
MTYYEKNKEKIKARSLARHYANREERLVQMKEYREKNKEKHKVQHTEWRKHNKERTNTINAKSRRKYPEKHCARQAKRRATKLNATPVWADLEAIKSWYSLAKMFDKTFKEKHHVDHIVPLQGKNICGLHVEYNLQVLTAVENIKKSNKEVYHFL